MSQTPISFPPAELTLREQIRVRAEHPETADKVFLMHDARRWSYRRFRDEATRVAHFVLGRLGASDEKRPPHVAMLLENHLELVALFGGCGIAGATLFGINTGLRGEVLAGVVNHSRSRLLVVDDKLLPEVDRVRAELRTVARENIVTLSELRRCLDAEVGPAEAARPYPDVVVTPQTNLMVIYTSGTTGLPKGIINNHFKLCATGVGVSMNTGMHRDDIGYACMPLFHSNSLFVGLMPCFWVGGGMGLRERFSGSRFVPDCFEYGVSMWNYVGEPVHYVLAAIEKEHGGDPERIRREVTENARNRLRFAIGNGASPVDIDKFTAWLGLDDMFELYGSTEAAISTFRRMGDPRGSVGEITDPNVKILDERGGECAPAELDAEGKIVNYDAAVGEICRKAPETGLFQGYFDNPDANSSKYRDGVYHSGDLGHVLVRNGKRYLFFDGRTDDWIRKDGENFSALQVARLLSEHPDVPLAAAYGVPCAVSDELLMTALKLREGASFDPKEFFEFCERQIRDGGMDRKWFPDFVRIVPDFEYTGTQKVLVRNLKKVHFDPRRVRDPLFFRERGDSSYRPFTPADFERLRAVFRAAEREDLLDR
ncbi:MAG: AMP-binding protein [Deltaproteobacteria bacterium]|nr:AMP-binding protein [Deltaproteobacteria bacterium]